MPQTPTPRAPLRHWRSLGPAPLLLAAVSCGLIAACSAPDPDRDGFLLVDPEARAAGFAVEVSGERSGAAAPVVVPGGASAAVERAGVMREIAVAPGELVEIVGRDGEIRRGPIPRERFEVWGEAEAVHEFAASIGSGATPLGDGRFVVSGPQAFVLAALVGPAAGVHGLARPDGAPGPSQTGPGLESPFVLEAPAEDRGPASGDLAAPSIDPASLVGLYLHGESTLLLDAAGGYSVGQGAREVARGRFAVVGDRVEFRPEAGGRVTRMRLSGEALVDGVGIEFTAGEGA